MLLHSKREEKRVFYLRLKLKIIKQTFIDFNSFSWRLVEEHRERQLLLLQTFNRKKAMNYEFQKSVYNHFNL
jgi:hypothetical protein